MCGNFGIELGIEGSRAMRQHARQISMVARAARCAASQLAPGASTEGLRLNFPRRAAALKHLISKFIPNKTTPRRDDGKQG